MKNVLFSVFTLLILNACSNSTHIKYHPQAPETFSIINAVGYAPISSQRGSNSTEKMLNAMRASKLAAYRELTEQIHGFQIDGQSTFSELVIQNSQLNASVQGLVRGAKVIKSYPLNDDIYATELSLDFKIVHELYSSSTFARKVSN